jgi:hypothetical protein
VGPLKENISAPDIEFTEIRGESLALQGEDEADPDRESLQRC